MRVWWWDSAPSPPPNRAEPQGRSAAEMATAPVLPTHIRAGADALSGSLPEKPPNHESEIDRTRDRGRVTRRLTSAPPAPHHAG